MSDCEEWRPVMGFPGYEVSSLGQVITRRRGTPRVMRTPIGSRGYRVVRLSRGSRGDQASFEVHRLVARTFYGPPPDGLQVRHLDGNSLNNHLSNLRYGTQSENNRDTLRHGSHRNASKSRCAQDHPYDEANTYATPTGRRECRICRRDRQAAYRDRQATAA